MPRRESPRAPDLVGLRSEYLAALGALHAATQLVHQALDDAAAALVIVRDHIEHEGMVSDLDEYISPTQLRESLSTSINDLERVRHHAQRLLFRLLHAEGMTMSDIGRTWGVSRQLVSRFINEAQ